MKRVTISALMALLATGSIAWAQTAPDEVPNPSVAPAPSPPPAVQQPTQLAPTQQTTIVEPTTNPTPQPVVVTPAPHYYRWFDTQVGLELGGGVASYVGDTLSNLTDTGGTWDLRLIVGAHSPIGVEAGYVGTANSVRMTEGTATLTSNAFEGDLRLGTPAFPNIPIQVYGFGGAGVNRFDIVNSNSSGTMGEFSKVDTTFVLPFGGGLQFNLNPHLTLDARFTYRAMFDQQLVARNASADMYTTTARLGFVF